VIPVASGAAGTNSAGAGGIVDSYLAHNEAAVHDDEKPARDGGIPVPEAGREDTCPNPQPRVWGPCRPGPDRRGQGCTCLNQTETLVLLDLRCG
jgi:hypothetical protein